MRPEQVNILQTIEDAGGRVGPETFSGGGKGSGWAVMQLVNAGYLEWERGRAPLSQKATGLLLTDHGRARLPSRVGIPPATNR